MIVRFTAMALTFIVFSLHFYGIIGIPLFVALLFLVISVRLLLSPYEKI